MSFIVEDGSGLADAVSYVSVQQADEYHTLRGTTAWLSVPSSPPDQKQAALVRATEFIENKYRGRWRGVKATVEQALAWPRADVINAEGEEVPEDELPKELIRAVCEAAARELENPGSLTPDIVLNERVVSETVGPISTTYATSRSVEDSRPNVTIVEELLSGLVTMSGNVQFLLRA